MLAREDEITVLSADCKPIGIYRDTRPVITEVSLELDLLVVMYTDGLVHAGSRYGQSMEVKTCLQALLEEESDPSSQAVADLLLDHALRLDQGRPSDDISVVALRVVSGIGDLVRRMTVRLPLNPLGK
jgi:serine phosphatase RsbU (regulator of sigma subunit)